MPFSRGVLQHDLWPVQERILDAVATKSRTAVKACHASGKTFTAADAVLWWPTRYDDGIVVTTAPTWTQVEKLLWGHIHQAARSGLLGLPKLLKTQLDLGPENYALGLSTNEGVRFQGWHGRILIVLDEAPGVLPEIWEAIQGIRAGGDVHVLALGQPALLGGPFYNAFHSQRATWETVTISAFDTPNLEGCCIDDGQGRRYGSMDPAAKNLLTMSKGELDYAPRPYLTLRRWVVEMWDEYGISGSPVWNIKVLGEFPDQAEDALFALSWIEAAAKLKPDQEGLPLRAGVDVAGPGEAETVVSIRQGANRIALKAFTHADARGPVLAFLEPYRASLEQVNCDSVGQGWYFGLHLRDHGFKVRMVNVGEVLGVDKHKFTIQKDLYYWHLRNLARTGKLGGISDPIEQQQLLSIRYEHTPKGQTKIIPKDKMVEDGIPSPDRAEADMLAFATDPPAPPPVRRALGTRSQVTAG